MQLDLEKNFKTILDNFPIDVNSTLKVKIRGLKRGTKIYKVDPRKSPLIPGNVHVGKPYIIENPSGTSIACHPHIVCENLERLSLDCAGEFIKVLGAMNIFDSGRLAVLQILRAAPGYKIIEVLPVNVQIIWVRTEYRAGGYRSHSDEIRNIEITYRDYSDADFNGDEMSTLLIPDTFATGMSAENAIKDLLETGIKPRKMILYGFISIPALTRLGELASENGVELVSFAIGNIMQLAHNNYDMPLYGIDESLHSETGELKPMGSIADAKTLRAYLPKYISGLDQPGDWSERQSTLYTGHGYEKGDILGHLTKSKKLISSLIKINSKQPWYNDFHDTTSLKELEKLKNTLGIYQKNKYS